MITYYKENLTEIYLSRSYAYSHSLAQRKTLSMVFERLNLIMFRLGLFYIFTYINSVMKIFLEFLQYYIKNP